MSEMLIVGVDGVMLSAPPDQQENARWFYGSLLGLAEVASGRATVSGMGSLRFKTGGGPELQIVFDRVLHVSSTPASVALRVESLEGIIEALRDNGVEFVDDRDLGKGQRRCFCRDPFGNRLEFVQVCPAVSRWQLREHGGGSAARSVGRVC